MGKIIKSSLFQGHEIEVNGAYVSWRDKVVVWIDTSAVGLVNDRHVTTVTLTVEEAQKLRKAIKREIRKATP